jgi:methionyl-tRNA formyltransferase
MDRKPSALSGNPKNKNPRGPAYIVIGSRPWNRTIFDSVISTYPGTWFFFSDLKPLTRKYLESIAPRQIFFLHYSSVVPGWITKAWECIGFHMTDLPYGRGGSPLQNLILGGHRFTRLTAFRMTSELDAGPVYAKETLCTAGNAEEIYIRATILAAGMIRQILDEQPEPVAQEGKPVFFRRRLPPESEIPEISSLEGLYDFIRMLDAEEYPRAFFTYEGFRYEFRRAALYDRRIVADVTITRTGDTP